MKLVAPKPPIPESVTLETLGTKSGPRVNPLEIELKELEKLGN